MDDAPSPFQGISHFVLPSDLEKLFNEDTVNIIDVGISAYVILVI